MTTLGRNLVACLSAILLVNAARAADTVSVVALPPSTATDGQYLGNRQPLEGSPLLKLPIGSIQPHGWLRKQLELEADGLGGRLEEVSPYLKFEGNGWVDPNGKNGWEEVPYWLRGYGDLGYVLKDQKIIDHAKKWIDAIMDTQQPDGWFGPKGLKTALDGKPDMWPNMPVLNAVQSYYEFSGDQRVLTFMTSYFKWQNSIDPKLFSGSWQDTRFGDNIESIYWLYNRTGEKWLLDLPPKIHASSAKWWKGVASWHNVNFAQGFREPAEVWMQTKDASLLRATQHDYDTAMTTYGQFPGGGFAADENARPGFHDPRQGFETCGMVEFMRSFEMLSRISGDPTWLDRCENMAFNSLPAALTPDEKALHYLTSANVVQLDNISKAPGVENTGPMFAYSPTEPQYHCCIHNHDMGWPLYAEHLWLATGDGGLCAAIYNACDVTAKVKGGSTVTLNETTDYPFKGQVSIKVSTDKPAQFPIYLRIPQWCDSATVSVNGSPLSVQPKPLHYISIDRRWSNGDVIALNLPMKVVVHRWAQNGNSASVSFGPLFFSLKIGERDQKYGGSDAWPETEVYSTTPWNYGLVLDGTDPASSFQVITKPGPVADQPFTPETAPISIQARAKRISEWTMDRKNLLRTLQESPAKAEGPVEPVTLIPMGAARLRITAFPVVGDGATAHQWTDPGAASGLASAATPSASHCFGSDTVDAMNNGQLPTSSADKLAERMTFWDHRGSAEWVQYDLKSATKISGVKVYWYDDTTTQGDCRVPKSWRVVYKDGDSWKPVQGATNYSTRIDHFNTVKFQPVQTSALRIEVQLQPQYSAGVLQWLVE